LLQYIKEVWVKDEPPREKKMSISFALFGGFFEKISFKNTGIYAERKGLKTVGFEQNRFWKKDGKSDGRWRLRSTMIEKGSSCKKNGLGLAATIFKKETMNQYKKVK
jgi:hypothetical protein